MKNEICKIEFIETENFTKLTLVNFIIAENFFQRLIRFGDLS